MKQWLIVHTSGLGLALVIGIVSIIAAPYVAGINGVMLAIVLGVLVHNLIRVPRSFKPGVSFSASKVLEWAILFMAFSINLTDIGELGIANFLLVLGVIVFVLLATLLLSRLMHCPNETGWLIGFGSAICGTSAIAAVAPSITQNQQSTGIAIAAINLLGAGGMLLLPFLFQWVPVSNETAGVMIGASLHSVGNVAGAGYGLENEVGDLAITVKMARVALLSPAVLLFLYLLGRRGALSDSTSRPSFSLPYYLWGFILITVINAIWPLPANAIAYLQSAGTFLLTIAMAGIGLKISFFELYQSGRRAIGFGLVLFLLQLSFIALALWVLA
jgi:uncharacterized integral membrane protein (TIGR00698 family)